MSSLPDILSVKTLPTISNMEIKTEVLDPITSSDSEIIFQIPKNGILDGGSFVSLAVTTAQGVSDAFFPINTGIHGLVKSAYLMSGSKVIASTEDYPHYATMVRQFEAPEHRSFVEQVKIGNCCDRWVESDAGSTATLPVLKSRLIPKDLIYNAGLTTATIPEFIKPTSDDTTTPVFNVALSQLIPFMRSRQLPLFAMKENVFLRLILNTQSAVTDGTICCFPSGSGSSGVIKPSQINIKFYSDHLYYLDGSMEATQKEIYSDNGLSYIYEDSVLTTTQIPASANPTAPQISQQKIERDIAISGRTIRSIMIAEKFTGISHNLLGLYHADAERTDNQFNFRINEQRYYDRDMVSPAMKYNELSNVMNKPLQVPKQIFCLDTETNKGVIDKPLNQNSVYVGQIEAHQLPNDGNADLTNDLRGKSAYVGVDLTTNGVNALGNGKKIGQKPVTYQLTIDRVHGRNGAKEIRFYSNVERVISIKNGEVILSA